MSDTNSDNTTGQVINHLIDKASAGLDQITQMLSKHAPQAWELACKGVYAIGASEIAVGLIALVFALLLISLGIWLIWRGEKNKGDSEDMLIGGGIIGCGLPSLCLLIFAFFHLLDSDGWARVISPDGYLAQQIITAAVN